MINNFRVGLATLVIVAFNIAVIVLSQLHKDDKCQKGTRAGMNLTEWMLIVGCTSLAYCFVRHLDMAMGQLFCQSSSYRSVFCVYIWMHVEALYSVFFFIMTIIGIVIFFTPENKECIQKGNGFAISAVVWFPIQLIAYLMFNTGTLQ